VQNCESTPAVEAAISVENNVSETAAENSCEKCNFVVQSEPESAYIVRQLQVRHNLQSHQTAQGQLGGENFSRDNIETGCPMP
jgi:hypothetical protein